MKTYNRRRGGFTLMEMLIVVAIIAIIVAISIPMLLTKREKVRETTDLANLRAAYAEVISNMMLYDPDPNEKVVDLVQGQDGWLEGTGFEATLHGLGQVSGTPTAFGQCTVKWLRDDQQVMFDFDGTGGGSGGGGSDTPTWTIDFSSQQTAGKTVAVIFEEALKKSKSEGYFSNAVSGSLNTLNVESVSGGYIQRGSDRLNMGTYLKDNFGYELPADASGAIKRQVNVYVTADGTVPVYSCSNQDKSGRYTAFYTSDGTEIGKITGTSSYDGPAKLAWVEEYLGISD